MLSAGFVVEQAGKKHRRDTKSDIICKGKHSATARKQESLPVGLPYL